MKKGIKHRRNKEPVTAKLSVGSSSFAFFECPLDGNQVFMQRHTHKLCPISGAGYFEGCCPQKVHALKVLQSLFLLE